jgi:hypothetical protein
LYSFLKTLKLTAGSRQLKPKTWLTIKTPNRQRFAGVSEAEARSCRPE